MITTAFVNLKPGTTKTTSAVFTAAALHDMGLETILFDTDPAASAQRWADAAGGFPWTTVGMPRKTIAREVRDFLRNMHGVQACVFDCPQAEDHAAIVRGVMAFCKTWIVPVAPAGIEVERTALVSDHMDEVDAIRETPGERFIFLTRTNRPYAPQKGPDAETRTAFRDEGWAVFPAQVPTNDTLYRRTYGTVPETAGTPYEALASYLAGDLPFWEFSQQYFARVAQDRHERVYGNH